MMPAERLQKVISFINKYVIETHGDTGLFTTAVICIINLQDGTLSYLNCGNEPPLILGMPMLSLSKLPVRLLA